MDSGSLPTPFCASACDWIRHRVRQRLAAPIGGRSVREGGGLAPKGGTLDPNRGRSALGRGDRSFEEEGPPAAVGGVNPKGEEPAPTREGSGPIGRGCRPNPWTVPEEGRAPGPQVRTLTASGRIVPQSGRK